MALNPIAVQNQSPSFSFGSGNAGDTGNPFEPTGTGNGTNGPPPPAPTPPGPTAPALPTFPVNYQTPGSSYQPGMPVPIAPPNPGTKFGNIDNSQLGSQQWGTGQSFIGAGQSAAIPAVEEAMGTQNPADASSMNAVRDYYNKQLYNLPQTGYAGNSAYGQSLGSGANSLSSILQRATGSQGGYSPNSYGGIQGTLSDKMAQAQGQGLNSMVNNAIMQSGNVGQNLENVNSADQAQRQANLGQAQTLANAIAQQQQIASGQLAQTQNMQQFSNTMQNANTMDFIMPFGAAAGYAGAKYATSPNSSGSTSGGGSGGVTGGESSGSYPTSTGQSGADYYSGNPYGAAPGYAHGGLVHALRMAGR